MGKHLRSSVSLEPLPASSAHARGAASHAVVKYSHSGETLLCPMQLLVNLAVDHDEDFDSTQTFHVGERDVQHGFDTTELIVCVSVMADISGPQDIKNCFMDAWRLSRPQRGRQREGVAMGGRATRAFWERAQSQEAAATRSAPNPEDGGDHASGRGANAANLRRWGWGNLGGRCLLVLPNQSKAVRPGLE